jgi:phage-related protein
VATIRNLLIRLGVDVVVDNVDKQFAKAEKHVVRFESALKRVSRIGAVGGGLGALGGAATGLTAALVPATGAILAMPAAMAATKAASGVLKVGLIGVGDAMSAVAEGDAKKLNEALEKLSPNARAFVRESGGFLKSFEPIRRAVQDRLFEGLSGQLKPVSDNLLPATRKGMLSVAAGFNAGAREALAFGQTPLARGVVTQVLGSTSRVLQNMGTAVQPALSAVSRLIQLGLPLMERMAGWAVNGVKAGAAFVTSERGATFLTNAVQRAGDTLAQLGRIGANFAVGLGAAFGTAKNSGDGFLDTIERLTASFRTWAQSAQGQEQMTQVWTLLRDILSQVGTVLPILLGPLGALVSLISSMPAPLQSGVTQFLALAVVIAPLAGRLTALFSGVRMVTGGVVAAASATGQFASGLVRGGAALGNSASAAARAGAALRTWGSAAVSGVSSAATMATSLATLAGAYAKTAISAGLAATRTAMVTVAQNAGVVATRIITAAQWLWNAAMSANPIGIVIAIIAALVSAIVIAYQKSETFRNIVQAVWKGIQMAISYAWNNIIKPVLNALWSFIQNTLAPVVKWLYNNVVKPYFNLVGSIIKTVWNNIVKPAFNALYSFLMNTLGPRFLWLHNTIVKPIMTQVGNVIRTAWNNVIKPVFDFLGKTITQTIPNAFKSGVNAIKSFWDKLVGIARTPVNFVIGLYNDGVANLVNKLAAFVGISARLPRIPKFASGGVLPGYAPGRDTMLAAVSPGESIFRPEFTKAVGSQFVGQANAVARSRGPSGVREWLTGSHALGGEGLAFARGGIVPFAGRYAFGGIIGDFIQGVKDFTIGNVAKGAKTLLDKIFGAAVPGGGIIKQIISAVPNWISEKIVAWVKDKVGDFGGGPAVARATAFAKAQNGKPYVWGGVGPGGYDCSGIWSALWNVLHGKNPYSRVFTTWSFGQNGTAGFVRNLRSPVMVGVSDAGVGHMAGTLGKTAVESSGSAGVRFGGGARGFNNAMFPKRYGLKLDTGGLLPPGLTPVYNGTGRPEYVFTERQMRAIGGNTYHVTVEVPPNANMAEIGRVTAEALDAYERRSGRRWRGPK